MWWVLVYLFLVIPEQGLRRSTLRLDTQAISLSTYLKIQFVVEIACLGTAESARCGCRARRAPRDGEDVIVGVPSSPVRRGGEAATLAASVRGFKVGCCLTS